MLTTQQIYERLQSDYDLLAANGYEVVGVFLFGSQNYRLDHNDSDIDVRGVVIGKPEDIAMGQYGGTSTYHRENGCLYTSTVQELFYQISASSLVCLEPLLSEWRIVNPEYTTWYHGVKNIIDDLVTCNPVAVCNYYKSVITHKLDIVFSKDTAAVEQWGYWSKPLVSALQHLDQLKRLNAGEHYSDIIVPTNHEELKQIKLHPEVLSTERAHMLADLCLVEMTSIIGDMCSNKKALEFIELKTLDVNKQFYKLTTDAVIYRMRKT